MVSSAADIVELALEKVGATSTADDAADESQFNRALKHFNIMLKELVGTKLLWWFVPASQLIELTVGEDEYDLNAALDTDLQFVQQVFIRQSTGVEQKVEMIRKHRYELDKTTMLNNGDVELCYIERNDSPKIKLLRAPATEGMFLRVEGQKYPANMLLSGGDVPHGFPGAWERNLMLRNAYDIGSGPVIRLPESELTRLERDILISTSVLDSFNKIEQVEKPRFTRPFL